MLILLSPSKKLDEKSAYLNTEISQPVFGTESAELAGIMKDKSPEDIMTLMGLSEKLANLNYERYQEMAFPFTEETARPALYTFKGDVYDKMDIANYTENDLVFATKHLRILSGLYGLLKPMDLMQPYRLEMGTSLENARGKNLYDFWGDKISEELNRRDIPFILNLASTEYFKAIDKKVLKAPIVTIHFKQLKNGQLKTIGLMAKRARGLMADYIIKNKITDVDSLKAFDKEGYVFQSKSSDATQLTFVLDMDR